VDGVDLVLLEMLQRNGRVSQHDLARAVGLSAPAVADRLRKLEERGVITGYTALLNADKLGRGLTAFVFVGVAGSRHFAGFRDRIEDESAVVECHSVTGEASHLLKVKVSSTRALEALLEEVQGWPGVQWTRTNVVMSSIKESTAVPLPEEMDEGAPGPGSGGTAPQLLHVPFRHHT
jgi:Lrp/AsnC family transcriptional regulator, leucine-responsive regulatory protein